MGVKKRKIITCRSSPSCGRSAKFLNSTCLSPKFSSSRNHWILQCNSTSSCFLLCPPLHRSLPRGSPQQELVRQTGELLDVVAGLGERQPGLQPARQELLTDRPPEPWPYCSALRMRITTSLYSLPPGSTKNKKSQDRPACLFHTTLYRHLGASRPHSASSCAPPSATASSPPWTRPRTANKSILGSSAAWSRPSAARRGAEA